MKLLRCVLVAPVVSAVGLAGCGGSGGDSGESDGGDVGGGDAAAEAVTLSADDVR